MKKIISILTFLLSHNFLFGQTSTPTVKIKKSNVLTLNSNFILPITRFNFYDSTKNKNAFGRLQLFNSIGAGIGLNFGRLTETIEEGSKNENIDQKFANAIGIQFGFLFSVDLKDPEPSNIFAPTIGISILDFQLGWGYELGTKQLGETRHFVTLSYGIPIQKLTTKGTWILKEGSTTSEEKLIKIN